ncbi:DUF86 domain-containing protein [Candidatus Harpocratesius sp.]
MNILRRKRYKDKIYYVKESLTYFQDFGEDEIINRGILYSIQVAIESTVDLAAMLVKDLGIIISDDRTNIENLVKHLRWKSEMANNLIKANGLRNVIVHQYNGIQKELISKTLNLLKTNLNEWIEKIEEVLETLEDN